MIRAAHIINCKSLHKKRLFGSGTIILFVFQIFYFSLMPVKTYALGSRNTAALKAMKDFAAGRKGVVCWCSRRMGGAVRIWGSNFDGSNLRRITASESGYDHIAPVISPDGSQIAYLRVSSRSGTTTWSNPKSFYADFVGDMYLVPSNASNGAGAKKIIAANCRSIFEWRVARWIDNDRLAFIGADHNGYIYTISNGSIKKIFNYPRGSYGALPNPQLTYCIDGYNQLFKINNPGTDGTLTQINDFDGCQGAMSYDGKFAYRTRAKTPRHINGMNVSTLKEWSVVSPSVYPADQNYLYFPKLSRSQRFMAVCASPNQHDHWTSDYDVFVVPLDPQTMMPSGKAVKYSFATGSNGQCLDSWPDVWVDKSGDPPKFSRLDIVPAALSIPLKGSAKLTAYARDQYGDPSGASMFWKVSGGGTLSSYSSGSAVDKHTVTFTSNGSAGVFVVSAMSGSIKKEVKIIVCDPASINMKINCGPNTPAVSGWEPDDNYVAGGGDYTFSAPISTAGVTNAAPADLYKTVRHYNHSFNFPVPNGKYLVRLHFADGNSLNRAMDYTIESKKVLDNFSIAKAAGGLNKAVVKEFSVTVADNNGLRIVADQDKGDDAFEAGIEIIGMGTINISEDMVPVYHSNQGMRVYSCPGGIMRIDVSRSLADENGVLDIYNIDGKLVRKVDGFASGRSVFWDGRGKGSKALSNGYYIIRLVTLKKQFQQSILLLR